MQPTVPLTTAQRWQVISYLRFIDIPDRSQDSAAARPEPRPVPAHELAGVRAPGADWLTYSGELRSSRHSELSQINRDSVGALATRWVHQFAGQPVLEVSPLVRDGVMFVSVPPCSVQALDARDGELLWSWSCTLLNDSASEIGGTVNRGVALLEDKVFVATWDARLVALSAATGKEIWRTTVDPDPKTYYISAAPLAFGDVVVTGVATREVGRAFVAAYDAATGAERWRFLAIPGPGERGNDTWSGDSWKTGGAPTWLTGSYDADLDLLYWGVGNPKPDYDTAGRSGDNLYTNSVVALRGKTGELVWHFQFTPADDKDWDANQIPIIADHRMSDGTVQKLLLWANRNGFYYTFDRESGKLLTAVPFVQQNWASGLDPNGRPIKTERADHGAQGELLFPGNVGGTSWWSPTYDAAAELMIVPVLEQGMVYFSSLQSPPRGSGKAFYTAVRALDASTGRRVWEYKRTPRFVDNHIGGLTSTAGGLVFGGDQSTFFALDAASGAELWSVRTGGSIVAAPVTYSVDGEQQVAIAAGGDLFAFALPRRPSAQPTVVADR
jgi:alcohol dehydrogenase (cytochrome c)